MMPTVRSTEGTALTADDNERAELAGVQRNPGCQAGNGPNWFTQEQRWGLTVAGSSLHQALKQPSCMHCNFPCCLLLMRSYK